MTHGEEEAQTKEERKEKSHVPLHDTQLAVHFFFFYFRGGRRNRRKQHEKDLMKELCPNTTHRERNTTLQHEGQQSQKELTNESTKLELTLRQVMTKVLILL